MFDWLQKISAKTKIIFSALLLILLPGAILGYLGLESVNQKIDGLRAHYRSTVGLMTDKVEGEVLQKEDGVRVFILKSSPSAERKEDLQEWLRLLEYANPFLTNTFLVNNEGGILSTILSKAWTSARPVVSLRNSTAAKQFESAESAEFATSSLSEAPTLYRRALQYTAYPEDRAMILARIGRCDFKLGKYQEGVREYKRILALNDGHILIGSIPASVVALSQIADGYQDLGDTLNRKAIHDRLYDYLVRFPWDIESGEYPFYLQSARQTDRPPDDDPKCLQREELAETILGNARQLDFLAENVIPKMLSDLQVGSEVELQSQHSFVRIDHKPVQFGFLRLPPADQSQGLVVVGYQFRPEYVTTHILPTVLKSSDIETGVIVALVDEGNNILFPRERLVATNHLAADNFGTLFPSWKLVLFDRQGRTIEDLAGNERTLYLLLLLGIVGVMATGVVVTVRAAAHEAELSKLKAEFVSNVSHELKTPLALIRMFGETLESGLVADESKKQEFYGIIRKESERLTHLIDNVLDFSKMDSGKKEYEFEDADLVAVVRNTLEAYKFHIRNLGFDIETLLPDNTILVQMDKDAISQAILNLLSNATKYSDDKKYIRIAVSQDGSGASISVEDHGIGIPRQSQARIFDKFYRVPSDTIHDKDGAGLGLTLTKHIIEAHGGTIDCQSAPGSGSTFTIKLPIQTGTIP